MTLKDRTNEQAVVVARDKIEELKEDYIVFLTQIVLNQQKESIEPTLDQLLDCQKKANSYFNYVENFVGNSGLLGAHTNGLWVTGFAEDCLAVLQSIVLHFEFLRSYKQEFQGADIEPSSNAYANMQRLIVEYLPKTNWTDIKSQFTEKELPLIGFDMPANEDRKKIPTWQIVTGTTFGFIAIATSIVIAIFFPAPSPWQMFVFRGALAIGLACITPIIPGFINLTSRINGRGAYFKIVAGGSIAIFVLIWLVNPPSIQ